MEKGNNQPGHPAHHPSFAHFTRWEGKPPDGCGVNFLGVTTARKYFTRADARPQSITVNTEYPAFDEEYFEWIDLLESVIHAQGHYIMFELGAGWGRWSANAAMALRRLGGTSYTIVAVEAEPTHFKWLAEHLLMNGLELEKFNLIEAAVAATDGQVGFHISSKLYGGPASWYGQAIGGPVIVPAVSLNTLLAGYQVVDLIDLDVQGHELDVLQAAPWELCRKVKRVHIGTHFGMDEPLRALFHGLGWKCLWAYGCGTTAETEWGRISFEDGVQSWVNPVFGEA